MRNHNRYSALPYIGDVFKNDYHNPARARRRLNGYKRVYQQRLEIVRPEEKKVIRRAIKRIESAKGWLK